MKHRQTWVLAFLYVGTFGSFIGYSAAMPLLIKLNFRRQPVPAVHGIGVNFAYYAFLGALVGSMTRPLGCWVADRYGGARVTLAAFAGVIVGTLGILVTLGQLRDLPPAPSKAALAAIAADPSSFSFPPAVRAAVDANADVFSWFLGIFLFVFACTGIGNGSVYKMIPAVFRTEAERATTPRTTERAAAVLAATKQASAAIGVIGAVGAIGGFLIPIAFSSPWVDNPLSATKGAFVVFTVYYVLCAAVTYVVYLRRRAEGGRALATAGI